MIVRRLCLLALVGCALVATGCEDNTDGGPSQPPDDVIVDAPPVGDDGGATDVDSSVIEDASDVAVGPQDIASGDADDGTAGPDDAAAPIDSTTDATDPGATDTLAGPDDASGGETTAPDVVEDTLPSACPPESDCSDGLVCTVDRCDMPGAVCSWELAPGWCLVNAVCRTAGEARPQHPCFVCNPTLNAFSWTKLADGQSCDDGDVCTVGKCKAAECQTTPLDCDDDNACTADSCDPVSGCSSDPLAAGSPCDDGSACTVGETCKLGACLGEVLDCDDGDPCTEDACDPELGCVWSQSAAACDDGDACTSGDACVDGVCLAGPPTNCNDGNICTHDLCDPETGGCKYEPNTATCSDGNKCTAEDACLDGACVGTAVVCDDANPCTSDVCSPGSGCVFTPSSGAPCDDGIACTTGDACVAGVCEGDESGCVCTPTFSPHAAKITSAQLGEGGYPGEALDVDGDPSTCAPEGDCEAGLNNAMGVLASVANDPLDEAVVAGQVMILVELRDLKPGAFELALHQGQLDPANAGCDYQAQSCLYVVDASMIDPDDCLPLVKLPATLSGNKIVAGGPDTTFPFSIPLQEDVTLDVTLFSVRFEGTVTMAGDTVTALTGVLGGAIPKTTLEAAIDQIPPDAELPIPAADLKNLLSFLLENDIDTTGDGSPNAASIALKLSGIGATISGTE